jgi:hypothetical protein
MTPEQRARQLASLAALRADPEFEAKRLAALSRRAVWEKIAAARRGKPQSPETIAKRAAAQTGKPLSPEHRAKISAAQKGKVLDPEHLANLRAAHERPEWKAAMSAALTGQVHSPDSVAKQAAKLRGRPLSQAHREAISRGQVRAYETGRRKYNAWEERAAAILLPLGFVRFPRHGGHAFDFGNATTLVEINSCRYHDHRAIKPTCPTLPKLGTYAADQAYRAIAAAVSMKLVELWACEESDWPAIIGVIR